MAIFISLLFAWTQEWIWPYLTIEDLKLLSVFIKINFLSLFDNITCGRHSALDIAILNEDKMFFCWSAYKSLSYSYVDQWLMLLMKSLKLVSRGGIPALIFSSDPLLFFLKYMKRLFCLFNSFQIKRIWII